MDQGRIYVPEHLLNLTKRSHVLFSNLMKIKLFPPKN